MELHDWILWQDETLLALNKPPGLRTIPDGYDSSLPYLSGLLKPLFGQVWVVHRLDKDTSGVILFARNAEAHKILNTQFQQRETTKEYRAILIGVPEWKNATIDLPLKVNGDRKHRTIVDHQQGKMAETEVQVLEHYIGFSLIAAFPHTGYAHQIRSHLAAFDFPILGDPLYHSLKPETQADRAAKKIAAGLPIQRTALHALAITFQHPSNQKTITIQAPYAPDFQETVEILSRK